MKKIMTNVLATTGITLIVLAIIGALYGAKFILINGVFQSFATNIVIHLGFMVTEKVESKYPILETMLDIGYTLTVLIVFGAIFSWYNSTPIWILLIMGVLIYIIGSLISIIRMREDVKAINDLLQRRKKRS